MIGSCGAFHHSSHFWHTELAASFFWVLMKDIQTFIELSAFNTASMTSSMAGIRLGRRPLFHWNSRSSSIMSTGSPGQTVGWEEEVEEEKHSIKRQEAQNGHEKTTVDKWSMKEWLARSGFSLIIFFRSKEETGSDFNHQSVTHYPHCPASYSHLRSTFNPPCPVHDVPFVGSHVGLPSCLQHAEEVTFPVLLLWLLIVVVRRDDPWLKKKHKHLILIRIMQDIYCSCQGLMCTCTLSSITAAHSVMKPRHTPAGQMSSPVQMWLRTFDLWDTGRHGWASVLLRDTKKRERSRAHLANFVEFSS